MPFICRGVASDEYAKDLPKAHTSGVHRFSVLEARPKARSAQRIARFVDLPFVCLVADRPHVDGLPLRSHGQLEIHDMLEAIAEWIVCAQRARWHRIQYVRRDREK